MAAFKVVGSAKAFPYCNTTGTLRNKKVKHNYINIAVSLRTW
jgi:hypothetical protein